MMQHFNNNLNLQSKMHRLPIVQFCATLECQCQCLCVRPAWAGLVCRPVSFFRLDAVRTRPAATSRVARWRRQREGPGRMTLTAAWRGNPGGPRWTPHSRRPAQFRSWFCILGSVSHNQEHLHALFHRKGKVGQVWKHGWEEFATMFTAEAVMQKQSEFTWRHNTKKIKIHNPKQPSPNTFCGFPESSCWS